MDMSLSRLEELVMDMGIFLIQGSNPVFCIFCIDGRFFTIEPPGKQVSVSIYSLISIYFVSPLAGCVPGQLLLHFTPF